MSASITFAANGNSLNAVYAPGGAVSGNVNGVVLTSSSNPGVIGSGYIDMSSSLSLRSLGWPAAGNFPTTNMFSILTRVAFIGSTSNNNGLFMLGFPQMIGTAGFVYGGGDLFQDAESLVNTTDILAVGISFTPTLGQFYDIVMTYNLTASSPSAQCFVDGTLLATNTPTGNWGSSISNLHSYSLILGANGYTPQVRAQFNEFVIWNGIIDPTNIQLTTGNGSLNGHSRTAFVQYSSFDGTVYTDPGVSNVRFGTTYTFAGLTETGTYYNPFVSGSGVGPAAQLTERTRILVEGLIQNNIAAELAAIRSDRHDNTISTEPPQPQSYFIYDGAHTYQCPAIFIVADSLEVQDEKIGPNYVNAKVKLFVTAVVEGIKERSLTVKAERYQAALFKILHQTTVTDPTDNVKLYILCKRSTFSPIYTRSRKADNMADFRKEVALELEILHLENPIS